MTRREQVMQLREQNKTYKEIGDELGISRQRVGFYLKTVNPRGYKAWKKDRCVYVGLREWLINNKCTMSELKPCPFCGGVAYLEQSHRAFIKGVTTRVAFVRCTNCNARTERIPLLDCGHTSRCDEANRRAIKAWNRRADNGL